MLLITGAAVTGSTEKEYQIQVHKDTGKLEVTYSGEDFGVIVLDFEEYRNTYIVESGMTEVIDFSYGNGKYIVRTARHLGDGKLEEIDQFSFDIELKDTMKIHQGKGYYSKGTSLGIEWKTIDEVFQFVSEEFRYDKEISVGTLLYYKPDLERFKEDRKGICVDYASLMGTALRNRGFSVRFPVGYTTEGEYHMWVEVYEKEKDLWVGYDPTFGIKEEIKWEVTGYY